MLRGSMTRLIINFITFIKSSRDRAKMNLFKVQLWEQVCPCHDERIIQVIIMKLDKLAVKAVCHQ